MKPDNLNLYALRQLYFYLTEGCNLCCRHCWLAPKLEDEKNQYIHLDVDIFKKIILEAKELGLTSVKFTGGEPLMHKEISGLIDIIKTENLGLVMETNGTLCTKELANQLAECRGVFVSVSLDGANAATHEWVRGIPGSFESAVTGIKNLVAAGIHPQIIMSIMRHNRNEMEALVDLAEKLGAISVKFNLVMPTERGENLHKLGETLSIEELIETGQWVERELAKKTRLDLIYHSPAAFQPLGRMFSERGGLSCGILSILGVLADGSYALCGIGTSLKELTFGHASKDRLVDIWRDNPILNELRDGLPSKLNGICSECLMRDTCNGSCIAQNYYTHRSLWAPHWFCDLAEQKGLFPATRLLATVPRAT